MIDVYQSFCTKAQVDGAKELIDLCRNGYQITFKAKVNTAVVFGLRHQRNMRKLTVYIGSYWYELKENGRRLKAVFYNDDGTIMSADN